MNNAIETMVNKVCVVTGATSGIGEQTAIGLALRGASVVIVGRDLKKCVSTVKHIKHYTDNRYVDYLCADLSDLTQVRSLATELISKFHHVDVLVNNAGAYFRTPQLSADGYEMNLALNYLSPFLLVLLLIETLKKSVQSRIINVSSNAHFKGKINLEDLHSKLEFKGFLPYAQSKLALLLFTYELARKLKNTHVTVNALHPGLVATNFGKNNGLLRFYVRRIWNRTEISAAEGAKTSLYLATAPEVCGVTGGYFVNQKQVLSSADSYNQTLAKRLWECTEKLTGFVN